MSTVIIEVHDDKDKELLKKALESVQFNGEVEIYQEENEMTEEDVAELEKRLTEYENDPSKRISSAELKSLLKSKYGL